MTAPRLRRGTPWSAVLVVGLLCAVQPGAPAEARTAADPAAAPSAVPIAAAVTAGSERGKVAWYGKRFAGRRTASGERFDPDALTMAHRSLPFGTRVKVTHVASGRSVEVRVNDRGPTQPDRIGDLSRAAARRLGIVGSGVAEVTFEVLGK